jgi:hypothetical protein
MSFFCTSGISTGERRAFYQAVIRAGELLEKRLAGPIVPLPQPLC